MVLDLGNILQTPHFLDVTLAVAFQPVVRLTDGAVVGYEALLRGRAPDGTWRHPRQILDMAREAGSLGLVESFVHRRALAAREKRFADLMLFVNVDVPALIGEPDLYRETFSRPAGSVLRNVVLEVTEVHAERLEWFADWCRRLGLMIALDDFGANESNFDRFLRLHPHFIKLDRQFVRGIAEDAERRRILEALLQFTRSTGKTLVAEGVETASELALLQSLGVPLAQGFFLGPPRVDAGIGLP